MLRVGLVLALLGGSVYGVWSAYQRLKPAAAPAVPPRSTVEAMHQCLDECEQQAIVRSAAADAGRICRDRCSGGKSIADRPNQPIRSITRAPADHSRPTPLRARP